MSTACLRLFALLLVGCVALRVADATACSATTQDVFTVGNKAADSSCNYGSIQDAINAATCATGTKIILNASGDYTTRSSCGSALGPQSSCKIEVLFTPTKKGSRKASLSVTHSSAGGALTLQLTGLGK